MHTLTVGKLLEIWQEAFTEGWNAHAETPWMDPEDAFNRWIEKEAEKLLNQK